MRTICIYTNANAITTCDVDQNALEIVIKLDAKNALKWFISNMMQLTPDIVFVFM